MRQREAAVRVIIPEILGIDEAIEEIGEDGITYGLTELGLLVNRFFISGRFTGKMDENDRSIVKVKDSFNELSLYIGTYYSDNLELLEELTENDPVFVIGKVSISNSQSQFSKRFYAENIVKISEIERKYLEAKAVLFLKERVTKISRAISSGMKEKEELSTLMNSEKIGTGLFRRFGLKGSVDVEKFSDLIDTFLEGVGRGNRETILSEIKNYREISLEEIADKFEGRIPREVLENEIRNLMNDGEIMEIKSGMYRYIP
jgi:RPA family protein